MWRFWWHRLFHRMQLSHAHVGDSIYNFYLCKCDRAWKVTHGCQLNAARTRFKLFTLYEEVAPGPIKQFRQEVAQDVVTL